MEWGGVGQEEVECGGQIGVELRKGGVWRGGVG